MKISGTEYSGWRFRLVKRRSDPPQLTVMIMLEFSYHLTDEPVSESAMLPTRKAMPSCGG